MALAEIIKPIRIKDKEGSPSSVDQALSFLDKLTTKVAKGIDGEAILASNLLQEGQRCPSLSGRLIREIEANQGFFSVSEETWIKALDAYFDKYRIPSAFILRSSEKNILMERRSMIIIDQEGRELSFQRIWRYNPDSGEPTSLRLVIRHQPLGE
jgi:hypothetical protein